MGNVLRNAGAFLLALVLAASIALGTISIVRQNRTACQQVNVLRAAIVSVLKSGEKGLPANPYYKQHPEQLKAAQVQYAVDLVKLGPRAC